MRDGEIGKLGTGIRLLSVRLAPKIFGSLLDGRELLRKGRWAIEQAPADRFKRACGLCVCLAGALMEVMSSVLLVVFLILFTPM